ncbi:MAG: hypothetical protein [Microviridae sp.]|nr:MAG: hypothetical protein [Microviridae sp.]
METKKGKKVREYRGHNQFSLTVKDVEKGGGHSMTIQDDSYSIREIMEKFTIQGELVENRRGGLYQEEVSHESEDLRQVMNMDLVDRDELMDSVKLRQAIASQKLKDLNDKIEKERAEKIKAEAEKSELKEDPKSDAKQSAKGSSKYEQKKAED